MYMRPTHYQTRFKYDLSPRQREVLDLIARGKTNAEIAATLGLSLDGAKWHVREILGKLDVTSREEAANYWHQENRPMARLARALAAVTPGGGMFKIIAGAGALAAVTVAVTMVLLALRSAGADSSPNPPTFPDATPTGTATPTVPASPTVLGTGTSVPSPSAPVATPTAEVPTPASTPTTTAPTPASTPEVTPPTPAPAPSPGSTGVPALDVLTSIAASDLESVASEIRYSEIACVAVGSPGEPPQCREGEAPGTIIPVIPFAQCEGSYLRPDEVANVLASFVSEPALHSVFVLNPNEANFLGSPYGILFQSGFETAGGEILPRALMLASDEDGSVTGFWSGCGASAQDIFNMLAGGQVLLSS